MANYDSAIDFVLRLEDSTLAGNVTHDSDGATRYGLLDKWHPDLVQEGYYSMDPASALVYAKNYYRAKYWNVVQGDNINDQKIAAQLLSIGVNDGTGRAVQFAQQALGVTVDRILGPATLAAINSQDPSSFLAAFDSAADAYYQQVVIQQPAKVADLRGWYNRVAAINNYQG